MPNISSHHYLPGDSENQNKITAYFKYSTPFEIEEGRSSKSGWDISLQASFDSVNGADISCKQMRIR